MQPRKFRFLWRRLSERAAPTGIAALVLVLCVLRPAMALPQFSRMYGVPCSTCHTAVPQLNRYGYAFQANYFNWPVTVNATRRNNLATELHKIPLSAIATFPGERDSIEKATTTRFEAVEFYPANGLGIRTKGDVRTGGYFVNVFGVVGRLPEGPRAGDLEDAYIALPISGSRGQLAITLGQTTPLMYQYDPVNSLTDSLPVALGSDGLGDPLILTEAVPTVRFDYFNNRARGEADGDYVSIGFPFGGRFTLNRYASLRKSEGAYIHAFRRVHGYNTYGLLAHADGDNQSLALISTYAPLPGKVLLTGTGSLGQGKGNPRARQLSVQADYIPFDRLALSGRLDALDAEDNHGRLTTVEALTFTPFRQQTLRLSVEAAQGKNTRSIIGIARIQL